MKATIDELVEVYLLTLEGKSYRAISKHLKATNHKYHSKSWVYTIIKYLRKQILDPEEVVKLNEILYASKKRGYRLKNAKEIDEFHYSYSTI